MVFKTTDKEISIKKGYMSKGIYTWKTEDIESMYKNMTKDHAKVIVDLNNGDSIEIEVNGSNAHERHLSCNAIINKLHGYA